MPPVLYKGGVILRVICLDVGERRIGVAVTDPLDITAQGVETIWSKGVEKDVARVKELCAQYSTNRLLLGLPRNMDGSYGERAEKCSLFAKRLSEESGIETDLWDERLTTVSAHKALNEVNVRGKKRKNIVDAVAAVMILEDYVASRKE